MNPKRKKIQAEYEKNAAKIAALQVRQKELEEERTELENLDIIGLVRSVHLTPEQLAKLLQGVAPAVPDEQEADHEEV